MMIDLGNIRANMANGLLAFLESSTDDFKTVKQEYEECLAMITAELGGKVPYASELSFLIDRRINAELTYSFYLGLRANMEYFRNPIANNFLNADFEVVLRETRSHYLPECEAAQRKLNKFYDALPEEYKLTDKTTPISEYESFIATYGLKIAHYCGFLFGNELYSCVEPGYVPDMVYTHLYQHTVEKYLEVKLPDAYQRNYKIA